MLIEALDTVEILQDLTGSAKRAAADLGPLAEAETRANQELARAVAEVERCARLTGALNQKLANARERMINAKRAALEGVAMERDNVGAFATYRKLRGEMQDVADAIAYVGAFTLEDANRALIEAELAQLRSKADHLEGRATAQRLKVATMMAEAQQYDGGVTLAFQDDRGQASSWSAQALEQVKEIRQLHIPTAQRRLAEHDERVSNERELISPRLLS
jgi:hypothetical protein